MQFSVFGTSVPKNDPNQDSYLALGAGDMALVAVFDGVGSSAAGREASQAARDYLNEEFGRITQESSRGEWSEESFEATLREWWHGGSGRQGAGERIREHLSARVNQLDALAAERASGHNRNLVVAATGTGKTVIAALDYRRQEG